MGFLVSQHGQLGAIHPPPCLSVSHLKSMRCGGAIPPPPRKRGISAILAPCRMKTRQNACDTPLCYTQIKSALPPRPPSKKAQNPPPKRRNFMCMGGFPTERTQNPRRPQNSCGHFRPQNCGRKNYGHEDFSSGKERLTDMRAFLRDFPGNGWVPKFCLCVFCFGSFFMGEKTHINKVPPKIPGQSREIFVYVFFSLCVFSFRSHF